MLTKIEIRTISNQVLSLLVDNEDREYYVKDISGLDPVKAEMTSTGVASIDGDQYQSSRLGVRNPVFTIGIQDIFDKSIRTLRQDLYTFFMPKTPITMIFYDDEYEPVKLSGRVETMESPPFQRDPSATISVLCFDPAFYELDTESVTFSFPPSGILDKTIPYEGTLDNGVIASILLKDAAGSPNGFQLSLQRPDGVTDFMEIAFPFLNGDLLTINTKAGEKSVMLTRNNQVDSILYALTYQSGWLTLAPGSNRIIVNGPVAASTPSEFTMSWVNKHGGL